MLPAASGAPPVRARELSKVFRRKSGERVVAVSNMSFQVQPGMLTGIVGPDGAGKTTLLRLVVGLMAPTYGKLEVLGHDVVADPLAVQALIGYMPQRFGLYEDLSVQENLDLYADLHGVPAGARPALYSRLMKMTALGAFRERLAGRLSGGMKQKLGLACTLVRSPRLLVLDEPTVGVDPLSRRELWKIVTQLVKDEGLTVLLTTSYLDEAERCDHTLVLRDGASLFSGSPAEVAAEAAGRAFVATPPPGQTARSLQSQLIGRPGIVDALPSAGRVRFVTASVFSGVPSSAPCFEDGFMALLHAAELVNDPDLPARLGIPDDAEIGVRTKVDTAESAIEVSNLVRTFGTFTAVNDVTFRVHKGEVFGLLGANGAGKTTTFRMLCGLLPVTSGSLRVGGMDVGSSRASVRERLGYMAQKFSLYGALSVRENLDFFARAYGLRGKRLRLRVDWAIEEFELAQFVDLASAELPGGYKQRLALAAALLHEPEILFLDEPTSGADPVARREFWVRINGFAEQGVTIIVTTHFMEEAEYCDRLLILEAGKVLAEGTPAEIRGRAAPTSEREPTMEDAFVSIVEAAQHAPGPA